MADAAANNNNDEAVVNALITYLREDAYDMPFPLMLRSIPYTNTPNSLGIKLYSGAGWKTVWASEDNDGFRFNEGQNTYGRRITALTMAKAKEMRNNRPTQGGLAPQKEAFEVVYKDEVARLIDSGRWDGTGHTTQNRHLDYVFSVWGGFNSDDSSNVELQAIATTYACIRLGLEPFHVEYPSCDVYDEFWSAVQACSIQLERTDTGATGGKGLWALPLIQALNLHFQHHTNGLVEPIVFHPNHAEDVPLGTLRRDNTVRHWVMDTSDEADEEVNEGKILIAVESRPAVRARLLEFLGQEYADEIPEQVDPPGEGAPAAPIGNARPVLPSSGTKRRRSS